MRALLVAGGSGAAASPPSFGASAGSPLRTPSAATAAAGGGGGGEMVGGFGGARGGGDPVEMQRMAVQIQALKQQVSTQNHEINTLVSILREKEKAAKHAGVRGSFSLCVIFCPPPPPPPTPTPTTPTPPSLLLLLLFLTHFVIYSLISLPFFFFLSSILRHSLDRLHPRPLLVMGQLQRTPGPAVNGATVSTSPPPPLPSLPFFWSHHLRSKPPLSWTLGPVLEQ
jgi:hypothetical protein